MRAHWARMRGLPITSQLMTRLHTINCIQFVWMKRLTFPLNKIFFHTAKEATPVSDRVIDSLICIDDIFKDLCLLNPSSWWPTSGDFLVNGVNLLVNMDGALAPRYLRHVPGPVSPESLTINTQDKTPAVLWCQGSLTRLTPHLVTGHPPPSADDVCAAQLFILPPGSKLCL